MQRLWPPPASTVNDAGPYDKSTGALVDMTVLRGFAIAVASGVAFGLGGGLVGYAVGRWLPDFFRTIFRIPEHADFDPVQVGLGLGLTNGLLLGVGVGLVVVIAVTWYNVRLLGRG